MLTDISSLPGKEVSADVVIVGSGIAGMYLAGKLAEQGARVLVLESGDREFNAEVETLNDLVYSGKQQRTYTPGTWFHSYLPEHLRGKNRVRQYGGTSVMWTGKWRAPLREELAGVPWVSDSAWPVDYDDFEPHMVKLADELEIGGDIFPPTDLKSQDMVSRCRQFQLEPVFFCWGEKTFRVPEAVRGHENIQIVLRATATNILLDRDHARVSGMVCRSLDGHSITAHGASYVLATGGIENARLLLASNTQLPNGVGNQKDLVGRYYQDHLKLANGRLTPGSVWQDLVEELRRYPRPKRSIALNLSASVCREHQLLRHSFYFNPQYQKTGPRFRLRKASRDAQGYISHYTVKFATEQKPNPDSRLTLSEQKDALGMPRINVDWQFTEQDHASARDTCALMAQHLETARIGKIIWPEGPPTVDSMTDSAHPSSTTRMGASAEDGVVDQGGRVFGHDNLYIVGSSVFPSGPIYSPTFTILVLTRRLAERLGSVS